MTKLNLGKMWRPVQKGGRYPGAYIRSATSTQSSPKVKAVNRKLAEAARGCKGNRTSDGSFQACIAKTMTGFKA